MACACAGRKKQEFVWTSADGKTSMTYTREIAAQAKVRRKGGTYDTKDVK